MLNVIATFMFYTYFFVDLDPPPQFHKNKARLAYAGDSVSVKRGLRVFYPHNLGQDAQKMKAGGQRTHIIFFMTHKFKLPRVTVTR